MINSRGNLLFAVVFLTIIFARLSVVLVPNTDIVISGFVVHHFWYGVLVLVIGFLIPLRCSYNFKLLVIGFGFGLVIDELFFMIFGGGGDVEYWSLLSVFPVMILICLVLYFRNSLIKLF